MKMMKKVETAQSEVDVLESALDNNIISSTTIRSNENTLKALASPYMERRNAAISPVFFINRDSKDYIDAELRLETHPMQFSDHLITYAGKYIGKKELTDHEEIAIIGSIATVFRLRVESELTNILNYIFMDIKNHVNIKSCLQFVTPELWFDSKPADLYTADPVNYIAGDNLKCVSIKLTDLTMYGTYITDTSIPYIVAAYLAKVIDQVLYNYQFESLESIDFINTYITEYAAILSATMKNWLELARYYIAVLPDQMK